MRIIFFLLLLTEFLKSSWSQTLNYQDIFAEDWKKAQTFEKENRRWMEPALAKNHISYPIAISIIFPELVRYSALRDKMEITLLKTLYVNLGKDYSNFSIGEFQMKPSFAEMIREKSPDVLGRKSAVTFESETDFDDIKDFRKSIVKDLEDPGSQINYLIAFIKICEKKFQTSLMNEPSRIMFLATAYNYGFDKTADRIKSMIGKKFFNINPSETENYSYADISLFWYNQYITGE